MPERLKLTSAMADAVATWLATAGSIDSLELQSGEYEEWARGELLDPSSPTNKEAYRVVKALNEFTRSYFWFFQTDSDPGWRPPSECPICGAELDPYDGWKVTQLLCQRDNLVFASPA